MKTQKKQIIFGILVICILILSWFGSMYWVTGEFSHWKFGEKYSLDFQDNKSITYEIKDLKNRGENTYKSTSSDGYVVANFSKTAKIKDIILNISFYKKDKSSNCQMFYATANDNFSEEKSVKKIITSGENVIGIEAGSYDRIRIDFADEEGVKFTVNSLELYEDYIPKDIIWLFLGSSLILIVISFIYIFKDTINVGAFSKVISKWENISEGNRKLISLLIVTGTTLFLVFSKLYYEGNIYAYSDIGSDTIMQYLPQYSLIINKIRNGTIGMWLPEVGYGYNLAYFFMFSPLLIIVLLLGAVLGTQWLPLLIVIYRVTSIFICAYVAFKYLELFSKNYNAVLIGAYLYAFNGFTIIWGQHYLFFDYPMYTILVFYLVEKYLRAKNKKIDFTIIAISFACMAFSVYMAYMIYLPVAVYSIIRYIQINEKIQWKRFITSMLHLALNIVIGFVGGLYFALPYIGNIMNSGRTTGEISKLTELLEGLSSSFLQIDLWGSLERFISANLSGIGNEHVGLTNYYEESQLFFSALFWVILFQFVFTIHKTSVNKIQMICKYVSVLLIGMAFFNNGFLYALYAFSQMSRRTTFVLFPILAIMVVIVIDNITQRKILSKTGLILGTIFSVFLCFNNYDLSMGIDNTLLIVVSIAVLIISVIIFVYTYVRKSEKNISFCMLILIICIFTNVTFEMYISVNREGVVDKEWLAYDERKSDTQKAIEYIQKIDDTYFRMDKNYITWNGLTDAYFTNYYPVTNYNSIMANHTKEYNDLFMNPLYLSTTKFKPSFLKSPNDIVQYSSLGLKYVLSEYPINNEFYKFINQIGDVYIYENLACNSFTTFFDDVVLKSEYKELGYSDRVKIQQKAMVIDDADADDFSGKVKSVEEILSDYRYVDLTEKATVEGENVKKIIGELKDSDIEIEFERNLNEIINGNLTLEMTVKQEDSGDFILYYDTGKGYSNQERFIVHCTEEETQISYIFPKETKKIRACFSIVPSTIVDISFTDSLEPIKLEDNVSILKEGRNSSHISGEITCDRSGFLYIPLVYDENWKVKIDGKESQTYAGNVGFLTVNISKGYHKIDIVYDSKEIRFGIICLVIAIFGSILYFLLCNSYMYKKKIKENV